MQAVNAVLYGKYTMEGEQFDTVEVDFGRSEGNNIEQADGKKWSEQDRDTFDPTHDIDLYCDQASGLVNIAIMDGTVWRLLNGFKLFREKLDTRRGSNSQLETAVKDPGAVVSFKGYYGDLAIVVAKTSYVADDGTEKNVICRWAHWSWGIRQQRAFVAMVPFRMRRRCPKVWWPLPVIRNTG